MAARSLACTQFAGAVIVRGGRIPVWCSWVDAITILLIENNQVLGNKCTGKIGKEMCKNDGEYVREGVGGGNSTSDYYKEISLPELEVRFLLQLLQARRKEEEFWSLR